MAKLSDDETKFLLSKYASKGFTKRGAEIRINRLLRLMVIPAATVLLRA